MFDTTDELLKQIALGKDSSLEVKDIRFRGDQVTAPHPRSMTDEFAAMGNTTSGVCILGVDDTSKTVVGIPKDKLDIVETWVREISTDLITPPLFCRIRKIPIICDDGVEKVIVKIDIPKSLFIHQSPGGYFHRIGSAKRRMPPDVLARLFQQRSQTRLIRFDELPVATASPEYLKTDLWKKI